MMVVISINHQQILRGVLLSADTVGVDGWMGGWMDDIDGWVHSSVSIGAMMLGSVGLSAAAIQSMKYFSNRSLSLIKAIDG
jgi:hypothetical protein